MSDFVAAALAGANPLIMELKRRDAEGNDLLGGKSVPDVVAAYRDAGAPCLSVVTGRWFGGDVELLRQVRRLSALPILQKDFITRRGQLDTARDLGVDAVLLTAQLLPPQALNALAEQALERGMTPFIEVVSAAEIAAIADPAHAIIAVNNKDIGGQERGAPDLGRSERLLAAVQATGTPLAVSASGVDSPESALRLLRCGFQALLVGTAVLAATDLASWDAVTRGTHRAPQGRAS